MSLSEEVRNSTEKMSTLGKYGIAVMLAGWADRIEALERDAARLDSLYRPRHLTEIELDQDGEVRVKRLDLRPEIARVCHEVNRQYCEHLGDTSQVPWEDAPEWQRESAVRGVEAHLAEENGLDPRASHEEWLRHKAAEGWVHGDVKDADAKTHPAMVPYDELDEATRVKDVLFGAIVAALRSEERAMGECWHTFTDEYGCVDRCGGPACDITGYCSMHEQFHDVAPMLRAELDRVRQVSNTYHADLMKAQEALTAERAKREEEIAKRSALLDKYEALYEKWLAARAQIHERVEEIAAAYVALKTDHAAALAEKDRDQ